MNKIYIPLIGSVTFLMVFYMLSRLSYNLFHLSIEVSMLLLGVLIFASFTISNKLKKNEFFKIVSPGILISSIILFIHAMTYSNLNFIPGYDANLPTQLWIIANFILAFSFYVGSIHIEKQQNSRYIILILLSLSVVFVILAFLRLFPDCYIEGSGLTMFKKLSELVIILFYAISIFNIFRKKDLFESVFVSHIVTSIVFLIIGELLFTTYIFVDDFTNLLGHLFKLLAFIEIYWIVRFLNIRKPIEELFQDLNNEIRKSSKSEALLQSSLDSFDDIIVLSVDINYEYLYFNTLHKDKMRELFSIEIEIGYNILDYVTEGEDRSKSKSHYDLALKGDSHTVIEEYGVGTRIIFESTYTPVMSEDVGVIGVTVFARDITSKVEEQRALKMSEEKYRLLTENMPLGIAQYKIILDDNKKPINYKFLGVNKVFEQLFGVKSSEIVGKNIWDIYPETEQHWVDAFNHVATTDENYTFEDYTKEIDSSLRVYAYKVDKDKIAFVIQDVTEERRIQKKIEHVSYHDQLTRLYNRRFFEEQLKRLDNPRNFPLSVIMGDVNGLKLVNDAFGHQIGDQSLKLIGDVILNSIRGNDIAARWGGDEFAILMPSSDADAAKVLIDRIQTKIKDSSFDYGSLSISFGIETKTSKNEDINDVFKSAEALMYQNKLVEADSIRGETINTIMNTLFEKSPDVKEHSTRVSEIAVSIAEKMELSQTKINDIRTIGMIHDIGKIAIDLYILDKPDELTGEEMKIIQQHPLSGSRMLTSSREYSRLAVGVLHHHERIDGMGYPNGISGDQIPIESKIIAVADAFDAMTAERPYRVTPLTYEQAIEELRVNSGTQFDKSIVDVFVNKVLVNNN